MGAYVTYGVIKDMICNALAVRLVSNQVLVLSLSHSVAIMLSGVHNNICPFMLLGNLSML